VEQLVGYLEAMRM